MPERERAEDEGRDLFTPSLTQSSRRELPAGQKPWRLNSQFYVAFFGGPLAVGAIGLTNARRLGLPRSRQAGIVLAGIVGFAAAVLVSALTDTGAENTPRLMLAVAGILAFLVSRELQKDADRLYGLNREENQAYESLWAAGLGAVFLFGIVSYFTVVAVS